MHKDVQPGVCVACQERPVYVKKRQLCQRCYDKQRRAAWNGEDVETHGDHLWTDMWPRPTAAQEQARIAHALRNLEKEARAERNQRIIDLAKQGIRARTIAAEVGTTIFVVHEVIKLSGVSILACRPKKPPPPPKPHELTPEEKLKQRTEQSLALLLSNLDSAEEGKCWNWTGYVRVKDPRYPHLVSPQISGYDPMDAKRCTTVPAYRVAYMLFVGPIPPGMRVRRTCYNLLCCNPEHLQLAAPYELRSQRWPVAGRVAGRSRTSERTHCIHGHPLVPENVAVNTAGHRYCKTCQRTSAKRYLKKVRARKAE